jgi:hypothetical protein
VSDELRIAALREEIRRLGERTARARRRALPTNVAAGALALAAVCGISSDIDHGRFTGAAAFVGWMIFGCLIIASGVVPALEIRREWLTRRLRQAVGELPAGEREELLVPLARERGDDVSIIATELLDHFRCHTEISPAAPPDGRGDEPSV